MHLRSGHPQPTAATLHPNLRQRLKLPANQPDASSQPACLPLFAHTPVHALPPPGTRGSRHGRRGRWPSRAPRCRPWPADEGRKDSRGRGEGGHDTFHVLGQSMSQHTNLLFKPNAANCMPPNPSSFCPTSMQIPHLGPSGSGSGGGGGGWNMAAATSAAFAGDRCASAATAGCGAGMRGRLAPRLGGRGTTVERTICTPSSAGGESLVRSITSAAAAAGPGAPPPPPAAARCRCRLGARPLPDGREGPAPAPLRARCLPGVESKVGEGGSWAEHANRQRQSDAGMQGPPRHSRHSCISLGTCAAGCSSSLSRMMTSSSSAGAAVAGGARRRCAAVVAGAAAARALMRRRCLRRSGASNVRVTVSERHEGARAGAANKGGADVRRRGREAALGLLLALGRL